MRKNALRINLRSVKVNEKASASRREKNKTSSCMVTAGAHLHEASAHLHETSARTADFLSVRTASAS